METNPCYIFVHFINADKISLMYYSHLIPIFFILSLAFLVFFKSSKNILSKIFLSFSIVFCFWLIADLVTWVSTNYYLIYTFWAPVDYLETLMFLLGLYFVLVFIKKKDISFIYKLVLFIATLIPFVITVTQNSVLGFNYSICEAINNNFLLDYRFFIEILVILLLIIYTIIPFLKKSNFLVRKSHLIVAGSMFLFLSIFGITSYISAVTGYYELNLYALFIIPAFLVAIIYSVFELDIFNFNIIRTQYLVVGLVILITGQLFFVSGNTDRILTIITVITSVSLSIILLKNFKKESDQRVFIEKLSTELEDSKIRLEKLNLNLEVANDKLKDLDKLKTEFISLASHQLRSPLTAIKGYTSMLIEGDYGEIDPKVKETIGRIMESSNNLALVVEDLLNVTKIEQGGMKYEMAKFDFSELVINTTENLSITAQKKGLKLINIIDKDKKYFVNGDKEKLRQVIINLIDNSMKYTKEGQIEVSLSDQNDKVLLSIKDTGAGISQEMISTLFKKFSRGDGAKLNSSGSGLGLYLVKEIMEAHKGRVWVESEGLGKGSTFFVEIDEVNKYN